MIELQVRCQMKQPEQIMGKYPSKMASQNAPGGVFPHEVGGLPLTLIDKASQRVLRGFRSSKSVFLQKLSCFEPPLVEALAFRSGPADFLIPGPVLAAFCFGCLMREVAP